jgi:heptosyltransferase-3
LGVPTIALFGPSPALQWAPFGQKHRALTGSACPCNPDEPVCESTQPCMAGIAPGQVFAVLMKVVP